MKCGNIAYHIILASPKIALENIATYTNPNED
jgi:hypothetical protein